MCDHNDSGRRAVRCPWCGSGTLTAHDISVGSHVTSQISCSYCRVIVEVDVNCERAMLPFLAINDLLNCLPSLDALGAALQQMLGIIGDSRQEDADSG